MNVENTIKRMKEFEVFSSTLCNHTNKKQVDNIMVIVCVLCNSKPKLLIKNTINYSITVHFLYL